MPTKNRAKGVKKSPTRSSKPAVSSPAPEASSSPGGSAGVGDAGRTPAQELRERARVVRRSGGDPDEARALENQAHELERGRAA